MFNYEMKDISIFKKNGNHLGFYAHELKDAFPELNNNIATTDTGWWFWRR